MLISDNRAAGRICRCCMARITRYKRIGGGIPTYGPSSQSSAFPPGESQSRAGSFCEFSCGSIKSLTGFWIAYHLTSHHANGNSMSPQTLSRPIKAKIIDDGYIASRLYRIAVFRISVSQRGSPFLPAHWRSSDRPYLKGSFCSSRLLECGNA